MIFVKSICMEMKCNILTFEIIERYILIQKVIQINLERELHGRSSEFYRNRKSWVKRAILTNAKSAGNVEREAWQKCFDVKPEIVVAARFALQ